MPRGNEPVENKTIFLLSPDIAGEQKARNLRHEIGHYFRDQDAVTLKWIAISSRRSRARLLPTKVSPAHTIMGRSVGDDNATIAIRISTGDSITFSAVYTVFQEEVSYMRKLQDIGPGKKFI